MDKLQELAALVFITPLYVIATVANGKIRSTVTNLCGAMLLYLVSDSNV